MVMCLGRDFGCQCYPCRFHGSMQGWSCREGQWRLVRPMWSSHSEQNSLLCCKTKVLKNKKSQSSVSILCVMTGRERLNKADGLGLGCRVLYCNLVKAASIGLIAKSMWLHKWDLEGSYTTVICMPGCTVSVWYYVLECEGSQNWIQNTHWHRARNIKNGGSLLFVNQVWWMMSIG